MRSRTRLPAAIAVVGALAFASPARASCVPAQQRHDFARADAVFVGRVVSVSANGASAVFRVLRVAKGGLHHHATVSVFADPFPSSVTLTWSPKRGQRWRVYAQRAHDRWVTNDCQGTRRLK